MFCRNKLKAPTSLFQVVVTHPLNDMDDYPFSYTSNAECLMLEIVTLGAAAALLMVHSKGKVQVLHHCFTCNSTNGEASSITGVVGASNNTPFKEVLGIHAARPMTAPATTRPHDEATQPSWRKSVSAN